MLLPIMGLSFFLVIFGLAVTLSLFRTSKLRLRYVGCLLFGVGIFVSAGANAKCAYHPTSERFAEYETIVLVSIESAREGAVPFPYGLSKGTVPGKLLTLRVVRSWKGSYRPGDVVYGWTSSSRVEDAYTHADVGAKILVFFPKGSPHEITSCNAFLRIA
jgi:hypothetical protein